MLERGAEVGGLAGSFAAGGERLEKFYHHWFTGDVHVMSLIEELGRSAGLGSTELFPGLWADRDEVVAD